MLCRVGAKRQCYLTPKSAFGATCDESRNEMRGGSSSRTFTGSLKSICRGYFITASSHMDRDRKKKYAALSPQLRPVESRKCTFDQRKKDFFGTVAKNDTRVTCSR